MPYPNDRRKADKLGDEALSPEYLAMLVACGGEVRQGDRSALLRSTDERRNYGRRRDDHDGSQGTDRREE
jgi:hypothetical protein